MIWLLVSSAWTVGVTLGSATTLRLSAWSWLASVIYYLVLEGGWGASLGKRLMGLRVTSQIDERWWLRVALRTRCSMCPPSFPLFSSWAPRGDRRSRGRATRTLRRTDGPGMCRLTPCSLLLTILLFSTARRGNGWTGVHERLSRACRAAERPPVRRIRRSEGVTCRSRSRLSSLRRVGPCAVHDGRRDRRRTIVRRHRSDPSSSCVDSRSCAGHSRGGAIRRDVSRPGRLLARRPPIAYGELGRLRGARRRAAAVSAVDIRLARGASLALEPHDRTRRFGSRRDGHPARSRACLEETGRTPRSARFSVASDWPHRTPIRLSVLSSCWRQSRGNLLRQAGSRPRRCQMRRS